MSEKQLEPFIRCPKCRYIPANNKPVDASGVRKCPNCKTVYEYTRKYECEVIK